MNIDRRSKYFYIVLFMVIFVAGVCVYAYWPRVANQPILTNGTTSTASSNIPTLTGNASIPLARLSVRQGTQSAVRE